MYKKIFQFILVIFFNFYYFFIESIRSGIILDVLKEMLMKVSTYFQAIKGFSARFFNT